jgi:membrane protein
MIDSAMNDTSSKSYSLIPVKEQVRASFLELSWLARVIISACDRFYWDNGFSKAAALAYTSLLSLIPLTALCFGIVAAFLQTPDSMADIQQFIFKQFMPGSTQLHPLIPYIQQFAENMRTLNVVVLATLVVTSLLLLNSIEYTLNEVWQVYEPRPITDRLAIFCAIIVLIPFFAVSGYYTSTKVEPLFADIAFVSTIYRDAVPFLIDFLAFLALYYLVPKAPVKVVPAAFGAFMASLLFGFAKHYFALYLVRFASYERVYETISIVPIFLFWLYISWTIVLFGAEVCFQSQHLPRTGKFWKRTLMSSGDGAMILAVQTLSLVARAFKSGEPAPNEIEVAEQLGCSSVILKPCLDGLQRAGIVMRGDGREMPLLLMRSPEAISVADIQEAVFKKRTAMFLGQELKRMYECFSGGAQPAQVTLAQLVAEGEGR